MSNVYKGYGVLLDDELVWSDTDNTLSDAKVVRDRDYPNGKTVMWAQSKLGGPTVHWERN